MKKRLIYAVMMLVLLSFAFPYAVCAEEIKADARGAVLMDAGSGKVLFEQNAHERVYPASITKIMTTLIAMESLQSGKISLEDRVVISRSAAVWVEARYTWSPKR